MMEQLDCVASAHNIDDVICPGNATASNGVADADLEPGGVLYGVARGDSDPNAVGLYLAESFDDDIENDGVGDDKVNVSMDGLFRGGIEAPSPPSCAGLHQGKDDMGKDLQDGRTRRFSQENYQSSLLSDHQPRVSLSKARYDAGAEARNAAIRNQRQGRRESHLSAQEQMQKQPAVEGQRKVKTHQQSNAADSFLVKGTKDGAHSYRRDACYKTRALDDDAITHKRNPSFAVRKVPQSRSLSPPAKASRLSRYNNGIDSSASYPPPLSASKRFNRANSSCSDHSFGEGVGGKTQGTKSRRGGRRYYGLNNRKLRDSNITAATNSTNNTFAITTVRASQPPVYRQYIHDRVHGHSYVPRSKREALKGKKNKEQMLMKKSATLNCRKISPGKSTNEKGEQVEEFSKEMDFASDAFLPTDGEHLNGVFRSIQSFGDSDRPEDSDDEEEEDPTDCLNRPPHFLCYLPPCVARWPGFLEQNRFCECVGRIGLHQGFKYKRIARRRIFAVGFTFNLLALLLVAFACMAISRDNRILRSTSFAKGVATIPNHPPFLVENSNVSFYEYPVDNVTEVATLYMGFRALTSDDGILVNPDSALFTSICRGYGVTTVSKGFRSRSRARDEPDTNFKEALAPEICGACSQSAQGFIISCAFNVIFIIKNMFSDVTRMYPKYDLNCPNFAGSLMAALSVFLGLYTILAYQSRCLNTLTKDLSEFVHITRSDDGSSMMSFSNSTLFMIPEHIRENWQGHESEMTVQLDWARGPGLHCLWLATIFKMVDAICNFMVPTPSITRDYQRREDYEYEYGDPSKFVDIDDEEDMGDMEQDVSGFVPKVSKSNDDDDTIGIKNLCNGRDAKGSEEWEINNNERPSPGRCHRRFSGVEHSQGIHSKDSDGNHPLASRSRSREEPTNEGRVLFPRVDSLCAGEMDCPPSPRLQDLPSFEAVYVGPSDASLADEVDEAGESSFYLVQEPSSHSFQGLSSSSDLADDQEFKSLGTNSLEYIVQDPCFSNGLLYRQPFDADLEDEPEYKNAERKTSRTQQRVPSPSRGGRSKRRHSAQHKSNQGVAELPCILDNGTFAAERCII